MDSPDKLPLAQQSMALLLDTLKPTDSVAIVVYAPVGSNAKLIDERRYAERETATAEQRGKSAEYGFLKIRYKLPNESRSRLLEQPIRVDAGVPAAVRQDVEFSTAVAGFAQLLRGGKYTGSLVRKVKEARGM